MEQQSITSVTTIDLSVAFNTVNHDILLVILDHKFGITDKALKWFDSYLCPRPYKVVTEGVYSHEKDLTVCHKETALEWQFSTYTVPYWMWLSP